MPNTRQLTAAESAELDALGDRPDSSTDPDCPPKTEFGEGIRGAFYRAIKKPVALRLDADVLD